jgi:hypothetical protein
MKPNGQILGAIAQLGERFNGIEEVVGSIPSGSTNKINILIAKNQIFNWSFRGKLPPRRHHLGSAPRRRNHSFNLEPRKRASPKLGPIGNKQRSEIREKDLAKTHAESPGGRH